MYSPKTWKDDEIGETPILAEDLNHMENGIASAIETDSVARVSNVVSKNKAGLKEIAWLQSMDYINTTSNGVKYKAKAEQYAGFNLILSKSLEIGKEYTISFKNNSSDNVSFTLTKTQNSWQPDYEAGYDKQHILDSNSSYTFTFTAETNIIGIMFMCSTNSNADTNERIVTDIQLDEGSTATPCVPYLNLEEVQKKLLMEPINISFNEEYVYSSDLNYICFKIGNIVFLNIHAIAFKKDIPHGAIIISNLPKAASDIIAYLYGGLNAKGDTSRVTINTNGNMNIHYGSPLYYGDSASNQYSTTIIYKTTD
mgnify:CR=1 FL=1